MGRRVRLEMKCVTLAAVPVLLRLASLSLSLPAALAYEPNWASLDKRPIPLWYDESKIGIFMHWGVYSVPAIRSEWMWWYWQGTKPDPIVVDYMKKNYRPGFTYADFGPQFKAEFFNATHFADIIKASGARYFVPTSKHHEGFTMYPSKYSWNWNSLDIGPHRDLIGELREAVLAAGGVHFGLYFSHFEWFNRLFLADESNNFTTNEYVQMVSQPQLRELVTAYEPEVIWSDGDWGAAPSYWNSTAFLAWLYNDSPVAATVAVNDRWGTGTAGKHGDFFNVADRYNPGFLLPHKWENAMTLDSLSWGFRADMKSADVLSLQQLLDGLASTISCGGNMLINVGPTHYGHIVPIFEQRLRDLGHWLGVNSAAVYESKPWVYQNDTRAPHVWFTSTLRSSSGLNPRRIHNPQTEDNTIVFAFLLRWPKGGLLKLGAPRATSRTRVSMLGLKTDALRWKAKGPELHIDLSGLRWQDLPSTTAWVLRLEFLKSDSRDPVAAAAAALARSRPDNVNGDQPCSGRRCDVA